MAIETPEGTRETERSFVSASESLPSEKHPSHNEDAVLRNDERGFFGVFDGMGGPAAGEVASRIAKEYIEARVKELSNDLSAEEVGVALTGIVQGARTEIIRQAHQNKEWGGMGTTASLVKIHQEPSGERKAIILNVGDSRVYRYREGRFEQLTRDDSVVRDQFSADEIQALQRRLLGVSEKSDLTEDESLFYRNRNIITSALGGRTGVHPTPEIFELRGGDELYITSDGIHDNLLDSEQAEIVGRGGSAEEKAKNLVYASSARSREKNLCAKRDDMTALAIKVK